MTLTESFRPLLTRSEAAKMTGLKPYYLDMLRVREVVRTYAMLGGRKHLFYRDELLKHLNLKT